MNLSRRQFLIANGAALALPTLPSLAEAPKKGTNKPSKKLAIFYVPNGVVRRCFFPGEENSELIAKIESDERLPVSLYPIQFSHSRNSDP